MYNGRLAEEAQDNMNYHSEILPHSIDGWSIFTHHISITPDLQRLSSVT